jgi:hypothetical protein
MKTLTQHILLYDQDCPICDLYSCGMQKTKMLDENGRQPYGEFRFEQNNFVNKKRAANEIALVDTSTNEVSYGIDALLKIFGTHYPIIGKIGNINWINFLLKKMYKFISYNRKVIAPSVKSDCNPDFNIKYRVLYIFTGLLFTAFTLYQFAIKAWFVPTSSFSQEVLIAFGQIAFQYIFLFKKDYKTILTYFGNLTTVSIIGSLLLGIVLGFNQIINIENYFLPIFFAIVTVMFLEHFRRIKILQLSLWMCIGWVLYRMLILGILFV